MNPTLIQTAPSLKFPSPMGEGLGVRLGGESRDSSGFVQKLHNQPVKRYVQTMDLKDDPALIAEYRRRHSREEAWKEIRDGIREVGILEMEVYLLGTRIVMVVDTPLDFDWDTAMARLATLPRQQEWEDYMAIFQKCAEGATSDEKWQMMDRIFYLYED